MIRRPPRSTRTDTLLPDTTLFRSQPALCRLLDGLEAQEVSLDSLPADLVGRYLATDGPHAGKTLVEVIPAADLRDPAARERFVDAVQAVAPEVRSEEHTSELQSLMRISYAVFCLKKKNQLYRIYNINHPSTI